MKNLIHLLLILYLLPISLHAQSISQRLEELGEELDVFIQAEMESRQIPGLTLGICAGNDLIDVRAFGYADVQNQGLVRDETVFELASITKQFTASAIVLLMQDGKLKLDDLISKYIDNCPEQWKDITLYHLLTHTSGLEDHYTGGPYLSTDLLRQSRRNLYTSKEYFFELIKTNVPKFTPGTGWIYSDPGYILLGHIIDNITGSYRGFLDERIFKPLGMTSTYIEDKVSVHPFEARGYTLRDGEVVNIRRVWEAEIPSHRGIFSNVIDLQKWDAALNSNSLFTDESKSLMWSESQLNNGEFTGYGLGWFVKTMNEKLIIDHSGITGTKMIKFVDEGVTFILLTNLGQNDFGEVNSFGLCAEVANKLGYSLFIEEGYVTKDGKKMVDHSKKTLKKIVGNYVTASGAERRFYTEDEMLYYEINSRLRYKLASLEDGRFIILNREHESFLEVTSEDFNELRWSSGMILKRQ